MCLTNHTGTQLIKARARFVEFAGKILIRALALIKDTAFNQSRARGALLGSVPGNGLGVAPTGGTNRSSRTIPRGFVRFGRFITNCVDDDELAHLGPEKRVWHLLCEPMTTSLSAKPDEGRFPYAFRRRRGCHRESSPNLQAYLVRPPENGRDSNRFGEPPVVRLTLGAV
jgi:hypothetical protein